MGYLSFACSHNIWAEISFLSSNPLRITTSDIIYHFQDGLKIQVAEENWKWAHTVNEYFGKT